MKTNKEEKTILSKERIFIIIIFSIILLFLEGFNSGFRLLIISITFFSNFYVYLFIEGICFIRSRVYSIKELVLFFIVSILGNIYVGFNSVKALKLILIGSCVMSLVVFVSSKLSGNFSKE